MTPVSQRDPIPFGPALLAAGVQPRYFDGPTSVLNTITYEGAQAMLQKEIARGGVIDHVINRLVRFQDRRTARELESLLKSANIQARKAAAFALGFAPSEHSTSHLAAVLETFGSSGGGTGSTLTSRLASVLGRPTPSRTGPDDEYSEEAELYYVTSYTLGILRDRRSIPGLISLLRRLRHFVTKPGAMTTAAMYERYSSERLSYLPRKEGDVRPFPSLTITGFVVEDLLAQFGAEACDAMLRALNAGGEGNFNLTFLLRRLGWVPRNALEQCFFALYDPNKSELEQIRFGETYVMPALNHEQRRSIVRSLADRINPFSYIMAQCFQSSVKRGTLPLWEELAFATEYDGRTLRHLGAFLGAAADEISGPVAEDVRARLLDAEGRLQRLAGERGA